MRLKRTQVGIIAVLMEKKHGNQAPLKPNGLSGGGLWVIPNIAAPQLYLGGIFIEHYKHKEVSFSTRIDKVVEAIRTA